MFAIACYLVVELGLG